VDEIQWRTCHEPGVLLLHVQGRISDRQLRLYGCACVRRIWRLLADPYSTHAVEVAERFADGQANDTEREEAYEAARGVAEAIMDFEEYHGGYSAALAAQATADEVSVEDLPLFAAGSYGPGWHAAMAAAEADGPGAAAREEAAQAAILRDLFPFRAVAVDAAWRSWQGGTIPRLAQAAYDERLLPAGLLDNARLAVLADALEEAGCSDSLVLDHLRGGAAHVRGCFAVDALLGRA
jgi:hypothetical protein